MADGLPAFGIVAAVMGVVHTMGSVGAPPSVFGEMIAAALLASMNGYAPTVAVEFSRKVLFTADRPSFKELHEAVRATKMPKSA